jgi:hypothetical protein
MKQAFCTYKHKLRSPKTFSSSKLYQKIKYFMKRRAKVTRVTSFPNSVDYKFEWKINILKYLLIERRGSHRGSWVNNSFALGSLKESAKEVISFSMLLAVSFRFPTETQVFTRTLIHRSIKAPLENLFSIQMEMVLWPLIIYFLNRLSP